MSASSTPDSRGVPGAAGWGGGTPPDPRRWWILVVIAIAQLMIVLDYTVAFWWTAGIFAAGAIICGALMRSGPLARPAQPDQPGTAAWDAPAAGAPRG